MTPAFPQSKQLPRPNRIESDPTPPNAPHRVLRLKSNNDFQEIARHSKKRIKARSRKKLAGSEIRWSRKQNPTFHRSKTCHYGTKVVTQILETISEKNPRKENGIGRDYKANEGFLAVHILQIQRRTEEEREGRGILAEKNLIGVKLERFVGVRERVSLAILGVALLLQHFEKNKE